MFDNDDKHYLTPPFKPDERAVVSAKTQSVHFAAGKVLGSGI
jgi:hypothetical protein